MPFKLVYFVVALFLISVTVQVVIEPKILVVGKSGTGKSTLINNLMDKEVAYVNHDDTGTRTVNTYNIHKYGYYFTFYDTPGLYELIQKEQIITMIKQKVTSVNIILLCYDLSSPRLYEVDKNIIKDIKEAFGEKVMNYVLIVYTKANLVKDAENRAKTRHNKLGLDILPFVLAYDEERWWIYDMWFSIYTHSNSNGHWSSFKINNLVNEGCFDIYNKINVLENGLESTKYIRDIKKGDYVQSNRGYSKIFFMYDHSELMDMIIITTNTSVLRVTPNHIVPVIRYGNLLFLQSREVVASDSLIDFNGKQNTIIEIDYQSNFSQAKYFLVEDNDFVIVGDMWVSTHVDNHNVGIVIRIVLSWLNYACFDCVDQGIIVEWLKLIYLKFVN